MPFAATWMEIKIIILIEVNHRKTSDITYMWNWKNITNEFIYKTEINSQT